MSLIMPLSANNKNTCTLPESTLQTSEVTRKKRLLANLITKVSEQYSESVSFINNYRPDRESVVGGDALALEASALLKSGHLTEEFIDRISALLVKRLQDYKKVSNDLRQNALRGSRDDAAQNSRPPEENAALTKLRSDSDVTEVGNKVVDNAWKVAEQARVAAVKAERAAILVTKAAYVKEANLAKKAKLNTQDTDEIARQSTASSPVREKESTRQQQASAPAIHETPSKGNKGKNIPAERVFSVETEDGNEEIIFVDFGDSDAKNQTDNAQNFDKERQTPQIAKAEKPVVGRQQVPDSQDILLQQRIKNRLLEEARRREEEAQQEKVVPSVSENKTAPVVDVYDDEDDEDDEVDNEQLMSLSACYSLDRPRLSSAHGGEQVIEVVSMRNGDVVDVSHIGPKQHFHIQDGGRKLSLLSPARGGQHNLRFDKAWAKSSTAQVSCECVDPQDGNKLQQAIQQRSICKLPLQGDIHLHAANDSYFIRRVHVESDKEETLKRSLNKRAVKYFSWSLGLNILFAIVISFLISPRPVEKDPTDDEATKFVQVDIDKLKPKKAKPKPRKIEKKKIVKPKSTKKKLVKKKPEPPVKTSKKAGGGSKKPGNIVQRDVKKTGLLKALGSTKSKKKSNKSTLADVTSLEAVTSLDANAAKMKIAGLSAKLANTKLTIPQGELIDTSGTTSVLRSGGIEGEGRVAALAKGDAGDGRVRGKVSAQLTRKVSISGGLSRNAVKSVIDENMADIVFCYETALVNDPGISGKVIYEWKVKLSGNVGEVKVKSSSVKSDSLHGCISSSIASWRFPSPQGSAVFVSYPFVFDMVSF
ncbi:MAG: AgmX/PglI C-terminal domain-containing protein [Gammaproteobacteria bacterium]|nr:AgmX/PglI C-terminal domain-containing protein [Gammaproteobacteria bacterium]